MSKIRLTNDQRYLNLVLADPIGWLCYKYCQIRYPEWVEEKKQELERKHKENDSSNPELTQGGVRYGN